MSFQVVWTKTAETTFHQLFAEARVSFESRKRLHTKKASKQEGLFKQVAKAIELLQENPRHPSLNTHEYNSIAHPFVKEGKVFEAYALCYAQKNQNRTPGAYRIFWCYGPKPERSYYHRHYSPPLNVYEISVFIAYEFDKWLQSKWQRDTRFYTLTLCQNIFGSWIIITTWGSAVTRGFGKSKDIDCSNYEDGLKTYYKLEKKREKRGYKRVD